MLYFHTMQTFLLVMEIGTTTIAAKFIFRHGKPMDHIKIMKFTLFFCKRPIFVIC